MYQEHVNLETLSMSTEEAMRVSVTANSKHPFLGGVPREQKMLKGHLHRVIYITKYTYIRRSQAMGQMLFGKLGRSGMGAVHPFIYHFQA